MKKRFEGKIIQIEPRKLAGTDSKSDFESFFLVLGVIFNDLKGLILFEKIIDEQYEQPDINTIDSHLGEYGGLKIQINKTMAGLVNNFFEFLKAYRGVTGSMEFVMLLKKLNPEQKTLWTELVSIAEGKTSSTKFASVLARVRSNIAFHYDLHKSEIRNSFIEAFVKNEADFPQYAKAMYSIGPTMETTRFYFSDAAVEQYLRTHVSPQLNELSSAVGNMNIVISALMRAYLESRQ